MQPYTYSLDALSLRESTAAIIPALSVPSQEELSFTRCFPIYQLQDVVENFEHVYGKNNEWALATVRRLFKDTIGFVPIPWFIFLDELFSQADLPIDIHDLLFIPGLERTLKDMRNIYADKAVFHAISPTEECHGMMTVHILLQMMEQQTVCPKQIHAYLDL